MLAELPEVGYSPALSGVDGAGSGEGRAPDQGLRMRRIPTANRQVARTTVLLLIMEEAGVIATDRVDCSTHPHTVALGKCS